MVITANFLAVALGGIFDRSSQLLTSDIMVTYPFTTSTITEAPRGDPGLEADTFAREGGEHWIVVNSNVVGGTDLPLGSPMNSTSSRSSGSTQGISLT